jgi:RNA polymerase sigma-70 factor, ECF subfamily
LAAQSIRRLLVDHARRRSAVKRDGGTRVTLDAGVAESPGGSSLDVLAVEDALAKLAAIESRAAQVVELRFFGGLDIDETAEALGVSPATVKRDWVFARAFLHRELSASGESTS